ncbi:MAG TPA: SMC family ATPase [Roseiflexaceae bacterium]|nr:SMC family ATPase [Roseiflexaceae bacterium]
MIPRRIALRNFMCYREELPPLDFDGISIACLAGENGAGKSALLDAMTWALWGEARLTSADDLIALGAHEMEVELIFTLDGQDFRVIRKRSRARRGQTWLDFQVRNGEGWKPLSGATVRETQQEIIRTLRMEYEVFANSAYLRQGRADEFTRKEPGRRKQVLADILGLNQYEQLEERARNRSRDLDGQIRSLDGQIEAYRRQAERRDEYERFVERALQQVADTEAGVVQAQEAFDSASLRVQQLEGRRTLRDERRRQAERLRSERDRLIVEIERQRLLYARAAERIARHDEIRAGATALQAAREQRERLETLRDQYDQLQRAREVQLQALRDNETNLRAELRIVEGELRGLRERAARRPKIQEQIAQLTADLGRFSTIERDLAAARDQRNDLGTRSQTIGKLQLQRADALKLIEIRADALTTAREEKKRLIRDATERLRAEPRLRDELEQARRARSELDALGTAMAELRERERSDGERAGALRAECTTIKAQGDDINRKIALLDADAVTCPLCGGELGRDGLAHIEAEYTRQRGDLRMRYAGARRDADLLETQLGELRAEIAACERRLAEQPEIAAAVARLEGELHALAELQRRQDDDQRQLAELELQIMRKDFEPAARNELRRIDAEIAAIGSPDAIAREIQRIDARIDDLTIQAVEHGRLRSEIEGVQARLRGIDAEDPGVYEQEARLQQLQTILELGDFAHEARRALMRYDTDLTALGYTPEAYAAARDAERTLGEWAEELNRLERAEEWMAHNKAQLDADEATLLAREAEIVGAEHELQSLEEELQSLGPAVRRRDEAAEHLRAGRADLAVWQKDLGEKQANLRRAEEAADELQRCQQQRSATVERKGLFDELILAYGKKGVQAMLIETAIPELEHEANALLGRMTDNQMHLNFITQGATKKGDVTETLEIEIADQLGKRNYDAYSGGEAFRLDFAIRIALSKLLARRAGARLETLVIDEGFGSQDARGRERLVEAITSVQHDFRRILVITHIQELRDMFPVQIEIVKTPQGSIWSIA